MPLRTGTKLWLSYCSRRMRSTSRRRTKLVGRRYRMPQRCGHEAVVKLLLKMGKADVDAKDKSSWTPLSHASKCGNEAVVKLLLEISKADVNAKDKHSRTPLSLAAESRHEAVVKLLLETGKADVNVKENMHVESDATIVLPPRAGTKPWSSYYSRRARPTSEAKDNDRWTPLFWPPVGAGTKP